jgi:hypothetical protein
MAPVSPFPHNDQAPHGDVPMTEDTFDLDHLQQWVGTT